MGKCSVCGAILCLAAKSSIVAIIVGEPIGEPEILRCPVISGKTGTGIFDAAGDAAADFVSASADKADCTDKADIADK